MNINSIIEEALLEDIGDGDHTSIATIPAGTKGAAQLVIKESGILSGVHVAEKVFRKVDKTLVFRSYLEDGNKVNPGDIVFEVSGNSISILAAERLALNFMQRMSGISTYTHKIVSELKGLETVILDTRKTTPLLRELEKYAVKAGGGENHRMGLYDMVMIKDNHVDFAGGISQAIKATRSYLEKTNKNLKIEIEVRDFNELNQVLMHGNIDRIMLDNFSPEDLKRAVKLIDHRYETEASGGITLESIRKYAESGVNFISIGALTHQIKSLDMSLLAVND